MELENAVDDAVGMLEKVQESGAVADASGIAPIYAPKKTGASIGVLAARTAELATLQDTIATLQHAYGELGGEVRSMAAALAAFTEDNALEEHDETLADQVGRLGVSGAGKGMPRHRRSE